MDANTDPTEEIQPFTEDDLRRLQKSLEGEGNYWGYESSLSHGKVTALLARLIAAEDCLQDYFEFETAHPLLFEWWKKLSGKIK